MEPRALQVLLNFKRKRFHSVERSFKNENRDKTFNINKSLSIKLIYCIKYVYMGRTKLWIKFRNIDNRFIRKKL